MIKRLDFAPKRFPAGSAVKFIEEFFYVYAPHEIVVLFAEFSAVQACSPPKGFERKGKTDLKKNIGFYLFFSNASNLVLAIFSSSSFVNLLPARFM